MKDSQAVATMKSSLPRILCKETIREEKKFEGKMFDGLVSSTARISKPF